MRRGDTLCGCTDSLGGVREGEREGGAHRVQFFCQLRDSTPVGQSVVHLRHLGCDLRVTQRECVGTKVFLFLTKNCHTTQMVYGISEIRLPSPFCPHLILIFFFSSLPPLVHFPSLDLTPLSMLTGSSELGVHAPSS